MTSFCCYLENERCVCSQILSHHRNGWLRFSQMSCFLHKRTCWNVVPGPSDASQVRNVPLHFNSLKRQNSALAPREMSALATRRGGYACQLPFSLTHCLHSVSQIGVIRNYISQTPLLTGWKDRRRKARVFSGLPLFTMLFYSIRSSGSVSSKALLFFRLKIMSSSFVMGLWSSRLLCPWDFPGKNIRVGCHFLLQRIFLTQGSKSNLCLQHCGWIRYLLAVCVCVCMYTPGIQKYQAPNKIQFTIPDTHRRAASKEIGEYNGKK